ncbi:MAG: DUF5696 domain-containing protein, partial [Oscillospiraceae bacterium]
LFDSALCASRKIAYIYDFDIAARGRDESTRARLLARDKLIKCGETLLKKTASLNTDGYSFNTLSNTAYSDYSDKTSSAAYSKAGMAADVQKILSAFAGKNKKIAVVTPTYTRRHMPILLPKRLLLPRRRIFDADIPFYQMVFKGRFK